MTIFSRACIRRLSAGRDAQDQPGTAARLLRVNLADPSEPRRALQALLSDTLAGESSAFGYALGPISFGKAVEVRLDKGATTFVMWLKPGDDEGQCYRKTARFKIGHRPDAPDRFGYALIDAICSRIEAWEGSLSKEASAQLFGAWPESRVDTLTCEWLAVRSGLKPACRNVADPEAADRLVEQARGSGLHALVTKAEDFVAGFCSRLDLPKATMIVHVARSEEAATATAEAERSMIESCRGGARATADQVRALGAALGYPACCIEAFIPVRDRSNAEIGFHALRRTSGAGSRLLNNIIEERALVSHCPCRYDCAPSLRYARALFGELARVHPVGADELERGLGGLVVSLRDEGALQLSVTAPPAAGSYRFETVEASGEGARLEIWRAALREADCLEMRDGDVRILRGGEETCHLDAPPDLVQICFFA